MTKNKQYPSKWDNITSFDDRLSLTESIERDLARYLCEHCGFVDVTHTGSTYKTITFKEQGIVLPDLLGTYKTGRQIYIEAKHKNRRIKFNDTGVNLRLIQEYLKAQSLHKTEVYLLFKDDSKELAATGVKSLFQDKAGNDLWYGNSLTVLLRCWKNSTVTIGRGAGGKTVIYFPLSAMEPAHSLPFGEQITLPQAIVMDVLGVRS